MFDRILEQVSEQFGLRPGKARQLLGMVVSLIFNPKHGGPAGFVQAFRDQGLGDVVGSWLGHGPNQTISAAQLEGVVGTEALSHISAKLGLPQATVGSAAAALLPDAVNELSEHGDLPTSAAAHPGQAEDLVQWNRGCRQPGPVRPMGRGHRRGRRGRGGRGRPPEERRHRAHRRCDRRRHAPPRRRDHRRHRPDRENGPAAPAALAVDRRGDHLAAVILFRGYDRREADLPAPAATAPTAARAPQRRFPSPGSTPASC